MQGRGRGGEVVQRKRVKRMHRRKKYQEEKMNGWWVSQENEEVEGKRRKQRQAELWDNYGVIILCDFSDYDLSRLWCKQLNREQFLP